MTSDKMMAVWGMLLGFGAGLNVALLLLGAGGDTFLWVMALASELVGGIMMLSTGMAQQERDIHRRVRGGR